MIISYYWPPAGGPGVQRWLKLSKYLLNCDIIPLVLTVDPGKATYPLRDESLMEEIPNEIQVFHTDTSELFGTYKKASGRKEVPFSGFANESDKPGPRQKVARFARGNFFIPDARRGWNKHAYKMAVRLIEEHNINTVITTSPPHSTQLIGLKLKKKLGVNWIADFRDPWTDIYYYDKFYPTLLARRLDRRLEASTLLGADKVIVVSDNMVDMFASKDRSLSRDKFEVIPNGFDPVDFEGVASQSDSDLFTITYAGTITDQYPLKDFLEVLSNPDISSRVRLRFFGRRDQKTESLLESYKSKFDLQLESYVEKRDLNHKLLQSELLLLIIPDIENNKGILTGKLFDYLGSGRPILNIGPTDGDAAHILDGTVAGKTLSYNDQEGMLQMMKELITDKESFKPDPETVDQYSRARQARQIADIILQLPQPS